ncbi:MAG: BamA/TamA family outer membrane protein [Bacteriovoracaceae bacterium]|nr:BamA/TamA family outer membrane protein [Bacteriovoracaceae bacterium]
MRYSLFFFLFLVAPLVEATILIREVIVDCRSSSALKEACDSEKQKWLILKKNYSDQEHLDSAIKIISTSAQVKDFNYHISPYASSQTEHKLEISFALKEKITKILFQGAGVYTPQLEKTILLKEDDFFSMDLLQNSEKIVTQFFLDKGYSSAQVKTSSLQEDKGIRVVFYISIGELPKIKEVKLITESDFDKKTVEPYLISFKGQVFDLSLLKTALESLSKDFFSIGFYFNQIDFQKYSLEQESVLVEVKVSLGKQYRFSFYGNEYLDREELLKELRLSFQKDKMGINANIISSKIEQIYRLRSFTKASVSVKLDGSFVYVNIKEGKRLRLKNIKFLSNRQVSSKRLTKEFYKANTDLISSGYYDEKYIQDFVEILKRFYINEGYLFVDIMKPQLEVTDEYAIVSYRITEGTQVKVSQITWDVEDTSVLDEIRPFLHLDLERNFSPYLLEEDVKNIPTFFRNKGYIYAKFTNTTSEYVVRYNESGDLLSLYYTLDLGPRVSLGNIIIVGNNRTRSKVLEREIKITKGDLLTETALIDVKNSLNALGLFSEIKVYTAKETLRNNQVDLIIAVKERNFGVIDIAPGFRTDLGLKLSSGINYDNLWGMNRSIGFKAQVNRRINGNSFDARRNSEFKPMFEYDATAKYAEPYIFHFPISYDVQLSALKRRLYSFDAKIVKLTNTFAKDFSKHLSTSIRHQFEAISQTDATDSSNRGSFQIGALTPGVSLDYRNNRANPTQGSYFNLSCEMANPVFLSQKEADLEINYYKLVSRNNFYIPVSDLGTIAFSASFGKERNLARGELRDSSGNVVLNSDGSNRTQGYIPSIKVFRLSGVDVIRGFDETEANRLDSGIDISNAVVQGSAYFANFRIEPRYFLNDISMLGLFFDAGRVFVDHFKPLHLRTSVGFSFRYLTPVGTLNFDYGFKTHREKDANGAAESVGRLHLSIGFF